MSMMNFVRSLRGRKTHVYCIGAAKTGTTSIAQIYNKVYRTAHEPEVEQTTGCVMDYLSGRLSETECAKRLMARDKRLNLEMESSHPLGYFTPLLVSSFPDAKFLVTIRDPRSWIKSRINFHLNKTPPEWEPYGILSGQDTTRDSAKRNSTLRSWDCFHWRHTSSSTPSNTG